MVSEYTEVVWALYWALYCEGDFMYCTNDRTDAESWVAADPEGHRAVTNVTLDTGPNPPNIR